MTSVWHPRAFLVFAGLLAVDSNQAQMVPIRQARAVSTGAVVTKNANENPESDFDSELDRGLSHFNHTVSSFASIECGRFSYQAGATVFQDSDILPNQLSAHGELSSFVHIRSDRILADSLPFARSGGMNQFDVTFYLPTPSTVEISTALTLDYTDNMGPRFDQLAYGGLASLEDVDGGRILFSSALPSNPPQDSWPKDSVQTSQLALPSGNYRVSCLLIVDGTAFAHGVSSSIGMFGTLNLSVDMTPVPEARAIGAEWVLGGIATYSIWRRRQPRPPLPADCPTSAGS